MNKKWRKYLLIIASVVILSLVGLLIILLHYQNGFGYGTWINGVYCTGKSVNTVNDEIVSEYPIPTVVIKSIDGTEYEIEGTKFGFYYDCISELKKIMELQDESVNVFSGAEYEIIGERFYDEEQLLSEIHHMKLFADSADLAPGVALSWDGEKYMVSDTTHDVLNKMKAVDCILASVREGNYFIDLYEKSCYEDVAYTDDMKQVFLLYDLINKFLEIKVEHIMGVEHEIAPKSELLNWLEKDANGIPVCVDGKLQIEKEGILSYVSNLASEYDTYNVVREYDTITGMKAVIPGGNYGNQINVEAETEIIYQSLLDGETEIIREPAYSQKAYYQGHDDIGPDFIEVDITNQKLYLVKDNEILIETDIVTGSVDSGWDTPELVCTVYSMSRNRVLRGPGYESPVSYWVPVYGDIGLHDASWRSKFGGEIYKKNGSHGCINIPSEVMDDIYYSIEIGYPVIIYSLVDNIQE